jgi:hypothetical protein
VENDDFSADIVSKPYLKYKYQSVSIGLKPAQKEAFLEAISERELEHLYVLNPRQKRGNCFFCLKKSNFQELKELKEPEKKNSVLFQTFQLDQAILVEKSEKKEPKRIRFRGNTTSR